MNITEFQKRISEADKPIVVDFWAPWCAPCKMTKPILEKLAKEYKDQIEFMPIDADTSRDILKQFKVIGIPTVLTLRDGEMVSRVTGSQNENSYRAMFQSLVDGEEVRIPVSSFDRMLRLQRRRAACDRWNIVKQLAARGHWWSYRLFRHL